MKVVPIIPALNPDEKLIKLVKELKKEYKDIIVVNDGSESDDIFKKLDCIILTHKINLGKGEGLKTAFKYYLDNLSKKYSGVVCLDADGQHLVSDAVNMSKLIEEEDKFILGTRLFNTKETPFRNKLGNRITSRVFKWLYKVYIKDTQTGLRGIPNRLIKPLLKVEGSRFEYELNVLIKLVKDHEEIVEYDIKTVYLKDSNKKSHYRVVKDSIAVYKVLFSGRKT
jgi:glycosyltransferase involved in cell wall biosynthesis